MPLETTIKVSKKTKQDMIDRKDEKETYDEYINRLMFPDKKTPGMIGVRTDESVDISV